MSRKKRLERLEEDHAAPKETPAEIEKRRKDIRDQAEHANYCNWGEDLGRWPLFEVDEEGDVFCTHDEKPVTDGRQILAESFYWIEVEWGGPGLVHDEEAQEFFTPEGELALSRDFVHLSHLMGDERMQRWESETG